MMHLLLDVRFFLQSSRFCNPVVLLFFSVLVENRRAGHRRILRSHFWNLQELWVGLHPLLPVQRLNVERAFQHRDQFPLCVGSSGPDTTAACLVLHLSAQLLFIPVLFTHSALQLSHGSPLPHPTYHVPAGLHVPPAPHPLPFLLLLFFFHPLHSGWTLPLQGQWDDNEWKLCQDCF